MKLYLVYYLLLSCFVCWQTSLYKRPSRHIKFHQLDVPYLQAIVANATNVNAHSDSPLQRHFADNSKQILSLNVDQTALQLLGNAQHPHFPAVTSYFRSIKPTHFDHLHLLISQELLLPDRRENRQFSNTIKEIQDANEHLLISMERGGEGNDGRRQLQRSGQILDRYHDSSGTEKKLPEALRSLQNALQTFWPELRFTYEIIYGATKSPTLATLLCGSTYHTLWNGNPLPWPITPARITQRLRQTVDNYLLPDSLQLTAPHRIKRLILLKASLPCLKNVSLPSPPLFFHLDDSTKLLIFDEVPPTPVESDSAAGSYPSATSAHPNPTTYITAEIRHLLGLPPNQTLCSSVPAVCEHLTPNQTHFTSSEIQIAAQLAQMQSLLKAFENIATIKRIDDTFLYNHWTPAGLRLFEELTLAIDHFLSQSPTGPSQFGSTLLHLTESILQSDQFVRQMYLPPTYFLALYAPIILTITLPISNGFKRFRRSLKRN